MDFQSVALLYKKAQRKICYHKHCRQQPGARKMQSKDETRIVSRMAIFAHPPIWSNLFSLTRLSRCHKRHKSRCFISSKVSWVNRREEGNISINSERANICEGQGGRFWYFVHKYLDTTSFKKILDDRIT
jgi:hypothetical protein